MNILNTIFFIATSVSQHIYFLLVAFYLLQPTKEQKTRPAAIIIYIISQLLVMAIQLSNNSWIVPSLFLFIGIYAISFMVVVRVNLLHAVLAAAFSYFFLALTQLPFIALSFLIFPLDEILYNYLLNLIMAGSGSVITYLVIKHFPIRRIFLFLCRIPTTIGYFLLIDCVFLALLCNFDRSLTHISPFLPTLLIITLVFSSAIFFLVQIFSNQRNLHALQHYEQYLPILDNLIQRVREVQHGHNNIVQSLVHLSELDIPSDDLRLQLAHYADNLQETVLPASFLRLENKLLAALFYYKFCQASEAGIRMEFTITNPLCKSSVNEFELVDAVSILLDNALEASKEEDCIYVNVNATEKNQIDITIENPGPIINDTFLHNIFSKGYSTKTTDKTEHGLGLNILHNLAKKHHGAIQVANTQRDVINYISFELIL